MIYNESTKNPYIHAWGWGRFKHDSLYKGKNDEELNFSFIYYKKLVLSTSINIIQFLENRIKRHSMANTDINIY